MKHPKLWLASMVFILALSGANCNKPATTESIPAEESATAETVTDMVEPVVEQPTESTPTPAPVAAPKPTTIAPKAPAPAPVVREPVTHTISMIAKQWSFEPSKIVVKQGDTVVLEVISTDVDHGFSLPGYGINLELKPGVTKTVTFLANKKGTFTFTCNVFCGTGHGSMKGSLVVE